MATRVPVGATLTQVYFVVPYYTGYGTQCDTRAAACRVARERKDRGWEQDRLANRVDIDERWVMGWTNPDGTTGTLDFTAERTEFAPDETREEWLARQQQAAQKEE